jgi:hypothetical protein
MVAALAELPHTHQPAMEKFESDAIFFLTQAQVSDAIFFLTQTQVSDVIFFLTQAQVSDVIT